MSAPHSHNLTSRADDDNDDIFELDVNDTAALIARMEEVERGQTFDSPVRTVQPSAREPHVEAAVSNGQDILSSSSSQPVASVQVISRSRGSRGANRHAEALVSPSNGTQLMDQSSRMTVSGIPLLDANMIPSHGEVIMPAERWNAFAMEVKPSVVYVAMALWQHLRDSEGNANASTSGTSATAPPKKKRRHKQHK